MFGYSAQFCPPSGIESCTQANFTGINDLNLIVAKHTLLEIYKLDTTVPSKPLQLIHQTSLYGNIQSIAAVKFHRSKDYLILTFKDAKV